MNVTLHSCHLVCPPVASQLPPRQGNLLQKVLHPCNSPAVPEASVLMASEGHAVPSEVSVPGDGTSHALPAYLPLLTGCFSVVEWRAGRLQPGRVTFQAGGEHDIIDEHP